MGSGQVKRLPESEEFNGPPLGHRSSYTDPALNSEVRLVSALFASATMLSSSEPGGAGLLGCLQAAAQGLERKLRCKGEIIVFENWRGQRRELSSLPCPCTRVLDIRSSFWCLTRDPTPRKLS